MAIVFRTATDLGNNTGGGANLTTAYAVDAASNLLVVTVVGNDFSDNISGVTYAGTSMNLAQTVASSNPGPTRISKCFYLLNPATGTNNVVVTCTGTGYIIAGAADYSGVGAFETSGQQLSTGTVSSITGTISTAATGDWIVAGTVNDTPSGAPTAGTGLTRRAVDTTYLTWELCDSAAGVSVGSNNVTVNFPSAIPRSAMWMMVFSPPAAPSVAHNMIIMGPGPPP